MRPASLAIALLAVLAACRRSGGARADGGAPSNANAAAAAGARARGRDPNAAAHTGFAPVAVVQDAGRPRAAARTASAGEVVRVPAGRFHLGSVPGTPGRDPAVEADGVAIDVPAFDIDALPYPNDPSQPVRTGATREEAAGLCRARSRRLCNEIEWERACAGPQETVFPGGDTWDAAACAGRGDPGACASGFGALVMGARLAEWTADNIDAMGVIRGGGAAAPEAHHRCAARRRLDAATPGQQVAFRCCGGAPPTIAYPREVSRPPFREERMGVAQLAQIVAQVPELARVRDGLAIFGPGAITEVLNHGATTADRHAATTFTVMPVRWSPTFGEELLVFTAASSVGSFVAALWVLPSEDGRTPRYRHAASYILWSDRVSMALGFTPTATREELEWSACWNCGGEHGVIHYDRASARVIAVQR